MDYLDLNLPLSLISHNQSVEAVLQRLLSHHFFTPTLGSYDHAAIAYGYSDLSGSEDLIEESLNHLAGAASRVSDFATDEDGVSGMHEDPDNNLVCT